MSISSLDFQTYARFCHRFIDRAPFLAESSAEADHLPFFFNLAGEVSNFRRELNQKHKLSRTSQLFLMSNLRQIAVIILSSFFP